jgi:hypothetical protein
LHDGRAPSDPEEGSSPSGQGAFARAESDEDRVRRFLATLHGRNERLSILLARTARVLIEEDRITLVFEDSQAFARKSVEQPQNLAILHESIREAEGRELAVEVCRAAAADAVPSTRATASDSPAAATAGRALAAATAPAAAAPAAARAAAPPADPPGGEEEDLTSRAREEPPPELRATDSRSQEAADRTSDAVPRRPGADEESAAQAGGARYQRLLSQALEDPVVRNLLDRFGGRIVEIKEVP